MMMRNTSSDLFPGLQKHYTYCKSLCLSSVCKLYSSFMDSFVFSESKLSFFFSIWEIAFKFLLLYFCPFEHYYSVTVGVGVPLCLLFVQCVINIDLYRKQSRQCMCSETAFPLRVDLWTTRVILWIIFLAIQSSIPHLWRFLFDK